MFGEKKYDAYNWTKGIKYRRVYSALLRHLWAWWRGDTFDKETGLNHLAHAMCCLMFLLHYSWNSEHYAEFDDRPTAYKDMERRALLAQADRHPS